jgi:hypothetical protein
MHQDLVNREDLPPEERRQASFELAEDYFKAGLLDHAEQVLAKMAEADPSADVHRQLLDIYIQEKDWEKAIDAAKKLEVSARRNYQKEIANYYCELAITEQIHARCRTPRRTCRRRSRPTASACARTCCAAIGSPRGPPRRRPSRPSRRSNRRIRVLRPRRRGHGGELPRAGRPGRRAHAAARAAESLSGPGLLNVVYQATAEQEGDEAAWRLVRDEVRRNPTLVGLDRLIDAELVRAPAERRQDLQLMKNLVHSHCAVARGLPVRELRIQGAAVLLAMPGVRWLGNLRAAAHGRARHRGPPSCEDADWTIGTSSSRSTSPTPMRRSLWPRGSTRPCAA